MIDEPQKPEVKNNPVLRTARELEDGKFALVFVLTVDPNGGLGYYTIGEVPPAAIIGFLEMAKATITRKSMEPAQQPGRIMVPQPGALRQ